MMLCTTIYKFQAVVMHPVIYGYVYLQVYALKWYFKICLRCYTTIYHVFDNMVIVYCLETILQSYTL